MPEQVIIEGDLIKFLNVDVIRTARLQDALSELEHRPPITIGPLPKSAIFVHWDESDPKNKIAEVICEVPPGRRTARYNGRQFQISVPWTYFVYTMRTPANPNDGGTHWTHENSLVYWAFDQIVDLNSMIATALVPNCGENGSICYGSTGVSASLPLGARLDLLTDEFYRTEFTHDSGTGSPWQSETGSSSWARWDAESKKDPAAWRNFPEWKPGVGGRGGGRITQRPLREVLGQRLSRLTPIEMEGRIPDIPEPMTFGRAEEWVMSLDPMYRTRLEVAVANLRAENPEAFGELPAAADPTEDPGGEPV